MIITYSSDQQIKKFKLLLLFFIFSSGFLNFLILPQRLFVNGGISFLICFFLFLFLVGAPLLILEIHISKKYKQPAWKFWRLMDNKFSLFGAIQIVFSIFLSIFYLFYFVLGIIDIFDNFQLDYNRGELTGASGAGFYSGIVIFLILFLLLLFIIQKRLKTHNIYWINITKFGLLSLLLIIFIYSLTLKDATAGVDKFFDFDHGKNFLKPSIWLDSSVLVFFTLFLSTGLISYNFRFTDNKYDNNLYVFLSLAFNAFISFIIGIVIYAIIGHAAYIKRVTIDQFFNSEIKSGEIGYFNYFLGSFFRTFYLFSFLDPRNIFNYFFAFFFLIDIFVIFLLVSRILITNIKYIYGGEKLLFSTIYYFILLLITCSFVAIKDLFIFEVAYFYLIDILWWVLVFLEISLLFWFSKVGKEIFKFTEIHSNFRFVNFYRYLIKYLIPILFFGIFLAIFVNLSINIFSYNINPISSFQTVAEIVILSFVVCVLATILLFSVFHWTLLKKRNLQLFGFWSTSLIIFLVFICAIPLIILLNAFNNIPAIWGIDDISLTAFDVLYFFIFILIPTFCAVLANYLFILRSYSYNKMKFFKEKSQEQENLN